MRGLDLEALLATAPDPALVVETNGLICYANPSAEKLFACSVQELRGRFCYQLLQGTDQSKLAFCHSHCAVREMIQNGQCPASCDLKIRTAQGERWMHATFLLVPSETGTSRRVLHLLHDIQERKELEDAIRAFLKHVSSLTGQEVEHLLSFAPSPHAQLSGREQLVLEYLMHGRTTRVIARELGVSVATVRNQIQSTLRKLSAHSRVEAIVRAVQDKQI